MKKWIFFNFIVAFTLYWLSNLILWYPWSINTSLGITLMLTISPIVWAVGIYQCLIRYEGENLWKSAPISSAILLFMAALLDYVFFGIIRNAIEQLYHPTTFYGYAFLVFLPFIGVLVLKKKLPNKRKTLTNRYMLITCILGIFCFLIIILIIKLP